MTLQTFDHTAECPRNQPTQSRKVAGALIRWCPACDRQGVAIPAAPAQEPMPATNFRCRVHGKSVSRTGKGCRACERELAESRQRKATRRSRSKSGGR